MVGPFALALAGLLLFLLLNIILSLTPLMVDRGIGMAVFFRLVALQLPKLLVLAVPMAALFATFLGLGRLVHDREVIAFESIGISLRRLLLPLVLAAAALSAADFALNNWAVPASERAFQRTYLEVVFRQSIPRIRPNAVFSGPDNLFFYVRRYDASNRTLHDVLIYDTEGALFPVVSDVEPQITLITAEKGVWTEATWALDAGRAYGFDAGGRLIYSGSFERLSIPVDESVEQILSQSRSPDEMGIAELIARAGQASRSGQRVDPYLLEIHHKIALPLASIVFVLLGGALSFLFGGRGRAVGIIAGLLLVSVFTGLLWWTQALGQRGAMHPALAAWLPNLLFGGLGLLLFLRVDRLASRDLLARLRRLMPFLALLLTSVLPLRAKSVPIELQAEHLFLSSDRTEVHAQGAVHAAFEEVALSSDSLHLLQEPDGSWRFVGEGAVTLALRDEISLSGDRVTARIDATPDGLRIRQLEAESFRGWSRFVNSAGESHTLHFLGDSARVDFDDAGEPSRIDIEHGEATTCNCCGLPLSSQPYTLRATRLQIHPDRLLVAFGLTVRAAGASILWLPFYVQPLEEILESPLFPAFGRSGLRGWFLKWSAPFYVSEELYGSLLFDYYGRHRELGGGAMIRYSYDRCAGSIDAYYLPAKVGDPIARLSIEHSFDEAGAWRGSGTFDYRRSGDEESLTFSAIASARLGDWRIAAAAIRTREDLDGQTLLTQRLPELSLRGGPIRIGPLSWTPELTVSWVRQWRSDAWNGEALRLTAGAAVGIEPFRAAGFTVSPAAEISVARYVGDIRTTSRTALSASASATSGAITLDYAGSLVSGESPFPSDRIGSQQHIAWRVDRSGPIALRMEGGLDLIDGSTDPVSLILSWGANPSVSLSFSYQLDAALLEAIVLRGKGSIGAVSASWTVPYDAVTRRLDPSEVKLDAAEDRSTAQVRISWEAGRLGSLQGMLETRTPTGWGLSLAVDCRVERTPRIAPPRVRLFRDIGDCIQVGIERASDQVWLYVSILAFPEAVLRYGTGSASFAWGE